MQTSVIKTKGFIIKEKNSKEYDKILTMLTPQFGKINIWANGVRKPTSHNIGKVRLFTFGNFELKESKYGYTLSFIDPIEQFNNLVENETKLYLSFYFLEVVDYLTFENINAEEYIKLLYYSFKALLNEKIDDSLVRSIFELKVLYINGTYSSYDNNNEKDYLKKTWNYVLYTNIEKLYSFVLNKELLEVFIERVRKEFHKNIDKKFNTEKYI
ncbi:MAG: DNA repair protein RecO [Eubacteriales bacterium]|nr:DNA repair protein RecO [Eubacteriales bacterium]